MTLYVVGLGYIGLPTALLAARDRRVVGVDIDTRKVETLNDGALPFEEPGLGDLFEETRDNFSARTSLPDTAPASEGGDTYLIATPTPLEEQTRVADLRHVRAAVEDVASVLRPGDTVVLESTVPPGTSARLVGPLLQESGLESDEFGYAYCPERAIPGNTLYEMTHNDRVVGTENPMSTDTVFDLYSFVEGEIRVTDPTTAEFVKLAENTHRDVNIAIANEFATLAEQYGIDGRRAIELANQHPRVDILNPGPGVGGHCLPIDPNFLTQQSTQARLIVAARDINDSMTSHSLGLVRGLVSEVTRPRITVLGVAYKGNVDDTRRTPAHRFCLLAENEGYDIRLHDPHAEEFSRPLSEFDQAVAGSDCLVILTDHDEYLTLDPDSLVSRMRHANIVDTRGLIDDSRWDESGFSVHVLGDGSRPSTDRPNRT
ncbi:nucleotide sugar dehydrogenase [Salinigranum marinum]|uniref:nucleotide sugar dehydrogenase n=1 Tax=Salinigranum marinum TaxID=1515595 RepID=UPI002989F102|nr:nucleotide sugar dehydrogenase [Salinigranum marinum]